MLRFFDLCGNLDGTSTYSDVMEKQNFIKSSYKAHFGDHCGEKLFEESISFLSDPVVKEGVVLGESDIIDYLTISNPSDPESTLEEEDIANYFENKKFPTTLAGMLTS